MSLTNTFQVANIPWRNNNFTLSNKDPPLSDQGETIIGVYLLVLGWLSWFGNSIVLFVLYRQRATLQPTDYLTFNLALSDASISVFGYSRGILEIFNVFQDDGYLITSIWTCQVDGFFTLLFGLVSINTLTVISITRYIKGCHPSRAHWITSTAVTVCLTCIWTAAAFWSISPLLGWGSFTDRGYGTCEVDWSKASYSTLYKSYIISILVCCFLVPVSIMLFSYVSIIKTVKRGNALASEGDLTDRQRKMERDVTIVSIVICTAFILAWSPYAVVSMWSAAGFHVPSLTSIFTRLFAKSASFYNPLIYFGLSSKFRHDVSLLLPCNREGKDSVRLKRFQPQADAVAGPPAKPRKASGGPKPPARRTKEKSTPTPAGEVLVVAPSPDSGVALGSPPASPPQVFIELAQPSEDAEFDYRF